MSSGMAEPEWCVELDGVVREKPVRSDSGDARGFSTISCREAEQRGTAARAGPCLQVVSLGYRTRGVHG